MHRGRERDDAVVCEARYDKRLGAEYIGGRGQVEQVVRTVRVGGGGPRAGQALIPVRAGGRGIELSRDSQKRKGALSPSPNSSLSFSLNFSPSP
eukprot:scaffold107481_cov63-Phaeocystis_antarctica.AAC.2